MGYRLTRSFQPLLESLLLIHVGNLEVEFLDELGERLRELALALSLGPVYQYVTYIFLNERAAQVSHNKMTSEAWRSFNVKRRMILSGGRTRTRRDNRLGGGAHM